MTVLCAGPERGGRDACQVMDPGQALLSPAFISAFFSFFWAIQEVLWDVRRLSVAVAG